MSRFIILLLGFLLILNTQYAQTPAPRASAHLFYFKPAKSILLFDGYNNGAEPASGKSEVWEWKNQRWSRIDSNSQPLRSTSAAAYIKNKDQIFIHGGKGEKGPDDTLRDSYIYKANSWIQVKDVSIGTRDHHEMAYDELNDMIVMYGGQNGQRNYDTLTWTFKGGQWKSLKIASPGPRTHHAMAYDPERKRVVLYGGYGNKKIYDDTWEFDGKIWTHVETVINPGSRGHVSMTYDPVSKKVLLYGGTSPKGVKGDIWAWNGREWKQVDDNGPKRLLAAIAFDPDKNKFYVLGGNGGNGFIYSDLWEWDGKNWTKLHDGDTYKFDNEKNKFIKVMN